ncbi:MAG: FAD-dependent oxidoreductase [Armatimonadota bacterium]|jgi:hypothetical protein
MTRYDLAVIGGGSGGVGAALSAARAGLKVALIDRADCLGGTSVRAGVTTWEPGAGGTGIPFDLFGRLRQSPNAVAVYSFGRHQAWHDPAREPYRYPGGEHVCDPTRGYIDTLRRHGSPGGGRAQAFRREHWHGVIFEPEHMARTMQELLTEAGCHVLLNTAFTNAYARHGVVPFVTLSNGETLSADFYIDSTGDAVVCASLGCGQMMGRESRDAFDEPHAPATPGDQINGVTLLYRVTPGADARVEPLPSGIPADCWWRKRFPSAAIYHYPDGDLNINMLPTMDGRELLGRGRPAAHAECYRRIRAHWHYLQTNYEEFRSFRVSRVAPMLGVRESRRIVGEYVLTEHDLRAGLSGQQHEDIICLADHAVDVHGMPSPGIRELTEPYGVPYRCLIPKGFRNLLVACRGASFSSIAASSCRLSRTMLQLGQAAGAAAAIAKELDVRLPNIPPSAVRGALREQHVQLQHPMPEGLRRYLAAPIG